MSRKTVNKLTMSGFRSFADQVSIDLSDGFAVVEDTGEGAEEAASDIAAALCFLTDRPSNSIKSIRDIIFQGNGIRAHASSAEVSLTVGGADGEPVLVSRRMYPDGRSSFYIYGEECGCDKVREAVDGAGIYGYSVLDHNSVTDIVTSRYGSLAFMIEQAAGVTELRKELVDAEKELEAKKTELKEIRSFLEEYTEKKKYLQDEAIRAKDYKKLNEELRTNEINIVLRKIEQCERSIYLDDIQIKELEERIAANESERDKAGNSVLEKKKRVKELDAEDLKNRDNSMGFMSDINDTKAAIDVAQGNIDTITENIDVINADRVDLKARADDERERLKEFEKKGAEISHNLTNNRKKREQSAESLRKRRFELSTKESEYDEIQSRISIRHRDLASAEAECDGALKIEKIIQERYDELLNLIEAREDEVPDEALYKSDLRTKDSLEAKKEQLVTRRGTAEAELEAHIERIGKLASKREQAFKLMNEEETRCRVLRDLDKNYEGYSESARALLTSASIRGIYGAAGELITVARGYESAIERALGDKMEYIICEDMQCAKEAAMFLKSKNAGRLVFLPVKDIQVQPAVIPEEILSADGCLGRALDFIDFDAAYSKAFDFMLGSTVIFKNMKYAEAAGNAEGVRIVTLDHEILNEDKVLEGGSPKDTDNGIFERKNRLYESESMLHTLEKDYNSADSEYQRALEEREILEERVRSIDSSIREYESDINTIAAKAEITGSRLNAIKKNISSLNAELKRTESELASRSSTARDLETKKENAAMELRQLEKRSAEKYKEIESLRAEIKDLKHEREELGAESSELESLMAANDSSYARIKDNIARAEKDIRLKEKSLEEVKEERASARRELETLEQKCRILEMKYTDRSTALGKLREEIDGSRDSIEKLQSDIDVLEKEYVNFVTDKRALEVKKKSSEDEAESLKKDIWDSYGISYAEALENKAPVFVLSEGVRESGRIRNTLADLGEVNIGSIAELEYVRGKLGRLEKKRSAAEDESAELERRIAKLKVSVMSQFKNTFDAVDAEFRKRFKSENTNVKARMRMTANSDTLENNADIVIRETAKSARIISRSTDEERTEAFNALAEALFTVLPASLVVVENIDRELGAEGLKKFRKALEENPEVSCILITGDHDAAEGAESIYSCEKTDDDSFTFRKLTGEMSGSLTDSDSEESQGE